MIKRIPLLLIVAAISLSTAQAQNPIWVEGVAGLAIPTQGDFRDAWSTGMTLGGRAGYGVNEKIDGTGSLKYNRYKFDNENSVFEANLVTINLMVGGRYKIPTESKLGYEVGTEIGISRISIDITNAGGILDGPAFAKTYGEQIQIEGDSATKFAWSLLPYVTYNIVANTYLFLSPSFNMIFAESNAHHLDVAVGARFRIGG